MTSTTELKNKAINVLLENLGVIETERFIALLIEEKFDYTKWQQNLEMEKSVLDLSKAAMKYRNAESE